MRMLASGVIYDGGAAPPNKRACAFTTLCLTHEGAILVSGRWGSARDSVDGHPCVFASVDRGKTWDLRYDGQGQGAWDGTPGEVKGLCMTELLPGVIIATGLWVDRSNPDLPFVNPRTQGLLPMRILHTVSKDGGRTWSPYRRMNTVPHQAASPCSMPVLSLPNRMLAQPYEHWKTYDDPGPGRPAARLRLSYDDGVTWPEYITVAQHPDHVLAYWDQRLAVHPATGQLVAMFWTHDFVRGEDRNVHIVWGAPDALSWTLPKDTGLPGQHCQPVPLGGDRLAAVYTRRKDPPGIALSISYDFGHTWERSQDLTVYDSTEGTEAGAGKKRTQAELWSDMERWRFGHPRAVRLPGNELFIVFYAGDDEVKSARWARVKI